jgi:hypothetical protein
VSRTPPAGPKPPRPRRRAVRALIVLAAAAAALAPGAGPAAAKSQIALTAALVRGSVPPLVELSAAGGDDAAGYQRLCVERRIGREAGHRRVWLPVACAPPGFDGGALSVYLPADSPGPLCFRARLLRLVPGTGAAGVPDRVSPTVAVSDARSVSPCS